MPLDTVVRIVNPAPERVVAVELARLPAVREPRSTKVADVLAGAVLGPKTVPKRTRQLLAAGLDEDILYHCHKDLPDRIYGCQ